MTTPARPISRVGLKYSMVEEPALSLGEKFQLLRDLGFDGVELDAPNEFDRDQVLRAREKSGLEIPGVINSAHWPLPLTSPDPDVRKQSIAASRVALENARDYGATTMLLVPGVVDASTSYARAWDLAREGVAALLDTAAETGVKIAIENVWNNFLLSPLEAARFIDSFESPLVGWYFDVGNVLRYGRPAHWIEALGPRILKLDAKEYSLAKMNETGIWTGFDVDLGDGDCNWAEVNAALRAVGYSGWASAEVLGGDRMRLAEIRRRMELIAAA